jgi:hypothetical protein
MSKDRRTGKVPYRPVMMERTEAEEQNVTGVRLQVEMVVKEDVILPFAPDGVSVGEILDNHLMDLARHGGEPRSFIFSFENKAWDEAKPYYDAKWKEREGVYAD